MRPLPTGTVTLLFTDIEGSTRLLQELGEEAYADALAEHRRLLREVFGANGGVEVDTQGDAFFVVFATRDRRCGRGGRGADGARGRSGAGADGVAHGTPHATARGVRR